MPASCGSLLGPVASGSGRSSARRRRVGADACLRLASTPRRSCSRSAASCALDRPSRKLLRISCPSPSSVAAACRFVLHLRVDLRAASSRLDVLVLPWPPAARSSALRSCDQRAASPGTSATTSRPRSPRKTSSIARPKNVAHKAEDAKHVRKSTAPSAGWRAGTAARARYGGGAGSLVHLAVAAQHPLGEDVHGQRHEEEHPATANRLLKSVEPCCTSPLAMRTMKLVMVAMPCAGRG